MVICLKRIMVAGNGRGAGAGDDFFRGGVGLPIVGDLLLYYHGMAARWLCCCCCFCY